MFAELRPQRDIARSMYTAQADINVFEASLSQEGLSKLSQVSKSPIHATGHHLCPIILNAALPQLHDEQEKVDGASATIGIEIALVAPYPSCLRRGWQEYLKECLDAHGCATSEEVRLRREIQVGLV